MNKIYTGNFNINKAYLSSDLTIKIYLGDNLVYPIEDSVAITFYDESGNTATINCDDLSQSGRIGYDDTESFIGTSYTSAVVGDCVTIIGGYSLPYQLTALTLSDSVEELEPNDSVPQNCVTLVCGTGLTTVGGYCMEYRTSIQSVTFNGTVPPTFNNNWEADSNQTFIIYVPCNSIEAYRTALSGKTANLNDRLQCIPTVQNKWSLTFANGDVRSLECNASGDSFPHQIDNYDWSVHNVLSPFDETHSESGVTSAVIGDCVAGIINGGMGGFINLSSVTINPETMYVYGGYSGMTPGGCCAFAGDYSLVEFPYSSVLESIGRDSFHGCSGLTDATIASSCTYIGDEAFFDCTGLEKVVMEGSTPPALGGDFVFYRIDSNAPSGVSQLDIDIEVPCDAVNTYKAAPRWSAYADKITCKTTPYDEQYLTFDIVSGGTINWVAKGSQPRTISYSLDGGDSWSSITSSTAVTSFNVNAGDKVLWKGTNTNYATNPDNYSSFSGSTATFNIEGNIMSTLYGDNFVGQTELTYVYTFAYFLRNINVISAENLILPTGLSSYCFWYLFKDCTSLTAAPVLSATTLAEYCYYGMFGGCTSLTTAPELPATTLSSSCYYGMFSGCTSLTTAPILSATTLANNCYNSMFYNCTSLTVAPVLSATTLSGICYQSMFANCTSLTVAPELPATSLTSSCYRQMFSGCTSLTTAPELPATTLANYCYRDMFNGCTSLNYIKCLANTNSVLYTYQWLDNVSASGTFVKAASMNDWQCGAAGIPNGWSVEDENGNPEISPCDNGRVD